MEAPDNRPEDYGCGSKNRPRDMSWIQKNRNILETGKWPQRQLSFIKYYRYTCSKPFN